jgi:hypothetical protein
MFSRATTASINCLSFGWEFSLLAVEFDAPLLGHREFRPLPPKQVVAFSDLIVGISFSIEIQVSLPLLHVPAFSSVAEPTVPSADFSKLFLSPHGNSSTSASFETSPGNAHLHRAYACHIYVHAFRVGTGL